MTAPASSPAAASSSPWSVFVAFLRMGLISFGGPIAHLGYFRDEFVGRRKWLDDATYADLVALAQFLPGPASSQVGLSLGLLRGGAPGMFAAWLGFTLPSAVIMVLFAYGVHAWGDVAGAGWMHGLKAMAVAVVTQAVWSMGRGLCPDARTATMAAGAAAIVVGWPLVFGPVAGGQVAAIAAGGILGRLLLEGRVPEGGEEHQFRIGRGVAVGCLVLFFVLLAGLPLLALATASPGIAIVDGFYRAGSLVFGGGHVLLPLLQAVVVPPGWVDTHTFLAGYGAAQALPGPLFTFAAYLGTTMQAGPGEWLGGLVCLLAVFAPSFLLIAGALPFWNALRARVGVRSALAGVNAAVVGVLLAALYDPVWTGTVHGPADFVLVVAALTMLMIWKWPPWLVAIAAAILGAGFGALLP